MPRIEHRHAFPAGRDAGAHRPDVDQPAELSRSLPGAAARARLEGRHDSLGRAARMALAGLHAGVHADRAGVRGVGRSRLAAPSDRPRGADLEPRHRAIGARAPLAAAAPGRTPAASGAVSEALARYLSLLRRGPYMLIVLGYAAYTFALGGLGFWMPLFLERVRAVPPDKATTGFGAIVVVTGVLGTLVGGWLGDYCLERSRQGYLWFSGVVTLAAVPFAVAALAAAGRAVRHAVGVAP